MTGPDPSRVLGGLLALNEEVDEAEALASRRQRRRPRGVDGEERLRIAPDDLDEHFADDAAADLAEAAAAVPYGRLAQDVEPQRSISLPAVIAQRELVLGQRLGADGARDRLARRQSGS